MNGSEDPCTREGPARLGHWRPMHSNWASGNTSTRGGLAQLGHCEPMHSSGASSTQALGTNSLEGGQFDAGSVDPCTRVEPTRFGQWGPVHHLSGARLAVGTHALKWGQLDPWLWGNISIKWGQLNLGSGTNALE